MKCPYIQNSIEQVHNKPYRYKPLYVENADGTPDKIHLVAQDSTCTTTYYLHDCLKEDCGAWQKEHCIRTS